MGWNEFASGHAAEGGGPTLNMQAELFEVRPAEGTSQGLGRSSCGSGPTSYMSR